MIEERSQISGRIYEMTKRNYEERNSRRKRPENAENKARRCAQQHRSARLTRLVYWPAARLLRLSLNFTSRWFLEHDGNATDYPTGAMYHLGPLKESPNPGAAFDLHLHLHEFGGFNVFIL